MYEEKGQKRDIMSGFHFKGRTKEENEADAFAQKEFDNLSKSLRDSRGLTLEEELKCANYIEANVGEDDEFDEFDDDFFNDAVTTQDYGVPSQHQQEDNNDKEFGEFFDKQQPAKKAKGIEIRWSEVEL